MKISFAKIVHSANRWQFYDYQRILEGNVLFHWCLCLFQKVYEKFLSNFLFESLVSFLLMGRVKEDDAIDASDLMGRVKEDHQINVETAARNSQPQTFLDNDEIVQHWD